MPYVQSITDVLSSHLGWHRARLKFMARFTSAMLSMKTTNLRRIAIALKAGVEAKSNYRRIQRFLGEYDFDAAALGRFLLRLLPQEAPYKVVIDRTEWHFGEMPVNVLVIGIAHQGMAFPVVWNALPDAGSSGSDVQRRLFDRFLSVVDPEDIEVVMADREFISMQWLRHLRERGVSFCVRLRADRRVGLGPEGQEAAFPARTHARMQSEVGEEPRVLCGQRYLFESDEAGEALPQARVVVRRIGADASSGDQFLILATSGINPEEATRLYQKRWEIETMFAALKSRGFDLEETHLTAPDRIERLIGLLALAFTWTRLVGQKRAGRYGPPPTRKSHGRRERSLFRYGLDWLQSILTTPEPQRRAFYTCLRGLRSPTAFLSCT
jgi:hypothetical protein